MGTAPEEGKTETSKLPASDPSAPRSVQAPARRKGNGTPGSFTGWVRAKRPVLMFVLLFGVLMGLFYACTFLPYINRKLLPSYMRFNARSSVAILNIFGEGATAHGTAVTSPRFHVDIRHGCDAIAPSALFVAAVLAFPASIWSKLPAAVVGTLFLAAINLVRIVTLFYAGVYIPKWFEAMHVDVWQPAFILLALTFWVIWAWWATKSRLTKRDVHAETD